MFCYNQSKAGAIAERWLNNFYSAVCSQRVMESRVQTVFSYGIFVILFLTQLYQQTQVQSSRKSIRKPLCKMLFNVLSKTFEDYFQSRHESDINIARNSAIINIHFTNQMHMSCKYYSGHDFLKV